MRCDRRVGSVARDVRTPKGSCQSRRYRMSGISVPTCISDTLRAVNAMAVGHFTIPVVAISLCTFLMAFACTYELGAYYSLLCS